MNGKRISRSYGSRLQCADVEIPTMDMVLVLSMPADLIKGNNVPPPDDEGTAKEEMAYLNIVLAKTDSS